MQHMTNEFVHTAVDISKQWLVLYCRPRFEFKVNDAVTADGIQSFFPVRQELRQWSDRKKRVTVPLFPGYLFVQVSEQQRVRVLEKTGAMHFVKFGGKAAVVSDEIIQSLEIAATRPQSISLSDEQLSLGRTVTVGSGPFAGMTGKLFEFRGGSRVVIQVEAIAQMVLVEVPLSDIQEA
jgi:transcriptional antiterminator RfaH